MKIRAIIWKIMTILTTQNSWFPGESLLGIETDKVPKFRPIMYLGKSVMNLYIFAKLTEINITNLYKYLEKKNHIVVNW